MAARSAASLGVATASVVAIPESAIRTRSRPVYQTTKRAIDLIGALILLVVFIPAFIAVGLAVVIDSGWPIFYRAERIGRDGRTFTVFKFRSMRHNADASIDRKSTRLNSSHLVISYAVFCLKKK